MRIVCVFKQASSLADHQRGRTPNVNTTYPLTVGKSYAILGMGLWENVLSILVRDDWGGPCFAPAGLFELGRHDIPPKWEFVLLSGIRASGKDVWTDPGSAIWGYSELVNDPTHAAALEEREPEALAIFSARVAEAERELQE